MGKLTEIIPPEERCNFCHKRRATKLCDFPIHLGHFVGHPPKIGGKFIEDNEFGTCSRKMCEVCATQEKSEGG